MSLWRYAKASCWGTGISTPWPSTPDPGRILHPVSKFLAYAYPVESEEEIRTLLDALRKKYYDTTKSGTGEQSTSSSTDGSSDTASNTSTDSAQSDTTSSSSDGSADATDTNGQGTDSTASSDAQSTPPATAEANKATSVRVINGTKISGHAASRAYTLKQAGYKNVVSANPSGTLPASTVVWYQNETDAATAKDIAVTRSEERRVGKECRSRWSPYH